MSIGGLRHRVRIERESADGQDSVGSEVAEWQLVAERWASLNPGRGREFESARTTHTTITHVVTMRYEARIFDAWRQARMRLLFKDRIFDVQHAVNKDERSVDLLFYCEETI